MTDDSSHRANDAELTRVSVIGLGTMGHGIAQTMALAGHSVRGYDEHPASRQSLVPRITANLRQMQALGIVEERSISDALGRITVGETEAEALDGAQFVTEAVSEDLSLKQALFERLETMVDPNTIVASNTSSYPMTEISVRMKRAERAIVTHWFNPPHIMPVVEVVPGERTSPETTQTVCDFLERIGKTPVRLNQEIPGFLVNRVQIAMFREIWDLWNRGVASAEDIDRAIRGSMGLRLAALGPLAVSDFAGWDVTSRVYQNLIPDLRSDHELPERILDLVRAKHYGAKTGQGVFEYPQESLDQRIADRDRTYLQLVQLVAQADGSDEENQSGD